VPSRDPDPLAVLIGRKLTAARTLADLSQRELAEATGVPQSHISDLERGTMNASCRMLARLSAALNVDPGFFLPTLERMRKELGADFAEKLRPAR
jgi:transcriptional regulator with XRE-family HTH domain